MYDPGETGSDLVLCKEEERAGVAYSSKISICTFIGRTPVFIGETLVAVGGPRFIGGSTRQDIETAPAVSRAIDVPDGPPGELRGGTETDPRGGGGGCFRAVGRGFGAIPGLGGLRVHDWNVYSNTTAQVFRGDPQCHYPPPTPKNPAAQIAGNLFNCGTGIKKCSCFGRSSNTTKPHLAEAVKRGAMQKQFAS